jgi:origin recognition complex subunit 6
MSAIRTLLKKFSYPNAAPHIYTGVESVLPLLARMGAAAAETPSKRPRRSANSSHSSMADVTRARTLGLVAVLCMYVLVRMMDQPVTPEEYTERRETAVKTLLELPVAAEVTYKDLSDETEQLMFMAQEEGWLQMEWFLNITPPSDGDEMEGVEATSAGPVQKSNGMRNAGSDYIGLGTMMQDATDYLGERQQNEYLDWKAKIMARVERIEAA